MKIKFNRVIASSVMLTLVLSYDGCHASGRALGSVIAWSDLLCQQTAVDNLYRSGKLCPVFWGQGVISGTGCLTHYIKSHSVLCHRISSKLCK